jgi:hypothetical protein
MSLIGFFARPRPLIAASARGAAAEALIDGYVAWREAASAVEAAYERWTRCTSSDRFLAFAGYKAALEREERAADVYQRRIERLRRPVLG